MNSIPRRKLSELAFLYTHHPDQCDVYVEGPFDKAFITWFLREHGVNSVAVYPIDSIEVPDGDLISAGVKTNNRERAIFLSQFLNRQHVKRATCIADADFWHLKSNAKITGALMFTDYSCMEMYLFTERNVSKFLILCCQRDEWPVQEIIGSVASVLQELFLYRFANDELGWGMDWLDAQSCMKVHGWKIILNADEYVARFLRKNRRAGDEKTFRRKVQELRPVFRPDARYQMHGHDFISIFSWYIRKKHITGLRSHPDNVSLYFIMGADHQHLSDESMFRGLMKRLGFTPKRGK